MNTIEKAIRHIVIDVHLISLRAKLKTLNRIKTSSSVHATSTKVIIEHRTVTAQIGALTQEMADLLIRD